MKWVPGVCAAEHHQDTSGVWFRVCKYACWYYLIEPGDGVFVVVKAVVCCISCTSTLQQQQQQHETASGTENGRGRMRLSFEIRQSINSHRERAFAMLLGLLGAVLHRVCLLLAIINVTVVVPKAERAARHA